MPQKKIYTKEEVDSKLGAKANTSDIYTKSQIDTKLNNKVNTSDFQIATDDEIKSLLGIS